MAKLIKIYGERNTNTNYLSRLLALNLDAAELPGTVPRSWSLYSRRLPGYEAVRDLYFRHTYRRNLGWKHAFPAPADELRRESLLASHDVAFLTLTKNPYAWLLSAHRRPYHQSRGSIDFDSFLGRPWRLVGRENGRDAGRQLPNPVELWNRKNASYLDLAELGALNLKAEGLLEDAEGVIEQISRSFSIPRKSAGFVNYEKSTKDRGKDSSYYRDYYLNERWRDKLTDAAVERINALLDRRILQHFGYELIT